MHVIEWNKSITHDNQINQSINQSIVKSCMWGPHQSPFISHELVSQILLFQNYEKLIHAYVKSRETRDYLRPEGN